MWAYPALKEVSWLEPSFPGCRLNIMFAIVVAAKPTGGIVPESNNRSLSFLKLFFFDALADVLINGYRDNTSIGNPKFSAGYSLNQLHLFYAKNTGSQPGRNSITGNALGPRNGH